MTIQLQGLGALRVVKSQSEGHSGERSAANRCLRISHKRSASKPFIFPARLKPGDVSFPVSYLEQRLRHLRRIGPRLWLDHNTGERLTLAEVLDLYGDRLPFPLRARFRHPPWFETLRGKVEVSLVEAQRLLREDIPREDDVRKHPPAERLWVTKLSEELAGLIGTKITQYAGVSQPLERTFPARALAGRRVNPSVAQLVAALEELNQKRDRFVAAGVLDEVEPFRLPDRKLIEQNLRMLAVYVEDNQKKLAVFDELVGKIEVLKSLVNGRFLYKRMTTNRESGFTFTGTKGHSGIPVALLSSGEQHQLVLYYQLLFHAPPGSLILIDEPELSLHVAWQEDFLRDIERIADLSDLYFLVATHSPQIISNRWDLTVQLEGPGE